MKSVSNLLSNKVFCPECKQELQCYDRENSTYFACASCDIFFKRDEDGKATVLAEFKPYRETIVSLKLGSEGTLEGKNMRVVGIIQKLDPEEDISWFEYLLYNPAVENYLTLVEVRGHWTLVRRSQYQEYKVHNLDGEYRVRYKNRLFSFYTTYKYKILFAQGEFDWNIALHADKTETDEYICPPDILVHEIRKDLSGLQEDDGRIWYKGTYIEPKTIAEAFNVPISQFPSKRGLGALQPNPALENWTLVIRFTVAMLVLVFITQFLFAFYKPERTVWAQPLSFTPDTGSIATATFHKQVTNSFDIQGPANLDIELSVPVYNEWIEVPVTLVNDGNGDTYESSKAIEYYHGYQDGESWSEGSINETMVFNSIPSGKYHLNIEAYAEAKKNYSGYITVRQNAILYSNLILMLAALLAYPVYLIWKRNQTEEQRWT
ncbi:MAG TPA: DUF4178 domain-containing protein [Flavipsychrobacter sp.]|nr:DUF4178 domain-containing protein [Flavipsychrobacter sp.]